MDNSGPNYFKGVMIRSTERGISLSYLTNSSCFKFNKYKK